MARQAVALFGGSFNPPHIGHVLGVTYALSAGCVERVLVVPVFEHALGKSLLSFEHRVEMARRAFGWLPGVEVSTLEASLGAPSRTLRTILALEAEHPDWALRLLVGSDIRGEIEKWHAFDQIQLKAPPLYLQRAGAAAAGAGPSLLPEVSSTDVRRLLARASPEQPPGAELTALVPRAVLDYIWQERLFFER
ncbi:MAG TPA: nicotinate-nicotinamide nucleotide adenylyltransferase [Polyangiaceae bacterium]|nr:nicotinate-nicotinamide nucleotide adenylyltransferase [Polyangiaceae bacterium]